MHPVYSNDYIDYRDKQSLKRDAPFQKLLAAALKDRLLQGGSNCFDGSLLERTLVCVTSKVDGLL